jgi:hypothetical protein
VATALATRVSAIATQASNTGTRLIILLPFEGFPAKVPPTVWLASLDLICPKGAPFSPPHKRATLTASRLRVVLATSLSVICARHKTPEPHSLGLLCFGSRLRHWLPTLLSSLIAPIPFARAWSAASAPLMGRSPLCHGRNISRLVTLGATLRGNFGGCKP